MQQAELRNEIPSFVRDDEMKTVTGNRGGPISLFFTKDLRGHDGSDSDVPSMRKA